MASLDPLPRNAAASSQPAVDPEFLTWADDHARDQRLHDAQLAQIARHPDPNEGRNATEQQRAWARRHAHQKHLHDSAMAQLRHR